MASDNKYDSFLFRASWWQCMKNLPNECRSEVYDAVCMYVFEGKEPAFDPMSATSMAVRFIINDLEYDKQKYAEVIEKRAAAGRRGAAVTNQQKSAKAANAENERQKSAKAANASNRIEENRICSNRIEYNQNMKRTPPDIARVKTSMLDMWKSHWGFSSFYLQIIFSIKYSLLICISPLLKHQFV